MVSQAMNNIFAKSVFSALILQSNVVFAAGPFEELRQPTKTSIKSIGVVPAKKKVVLELGTMRTKNPELPLESTLKSRMKKRLLARQRKALDRSLPNPHNAGQLRFGDKPAPQSDRDAGQSFDSSSDIPLIGEDGIPTQIN